MDGAELAERIKQALETPKDKDCSLVLPPEPDYEEDPDPDLIRQLRERLSNGKPSQK